MSRLVHHLPAADYVEFLWQLPPEIKPLPCGVQLATSGGFDGLKVWKKNNGSGDGSFEVLKIFY